MKYILSLFYGCILMVAILLPVHSCGKDPAANRGDTIIQPVFKVEELIGNHDAVLAYTFELIKQNTEK